MAFTPNGEYAYVTLYDDKSVSVIDTDWGGKVTHTITVGSDPRGVAVHPKGWFAYVTNMNGTVSVLGP